MGRGRSKAKQTKVARDLKYSSPSTDYSQLQRELTGLGASPGAASDGGEPEDEDGDSDELTGGRRGA